MTKLSDTQLVILGAAAQRPDLSVLPLPDSLKLKGGALTKVMHSLRNRGLIRVLDTDGGPERVVITSEGMAAIDVEQIAAATGWLRHTIRGAISGALKKKLGLMVEATRTREVGPNQTGAKGSATVYRIVS
jgi:Protein of unknown function (DUF3489)